MVALAIVAALAVTIAYREEAGPSPRGESVVAIFKTAGTRNAFWAAVADGVESGAQDFGLEVSIRAPRDEIYVDEQIEILRGAIAERPAAIVLAAGDFHRLVEPVRAAKALGIKVVCVDSFIESEDADAKVGTDNFEAGQKCGAALLRAMRPASGGARPRVAVMSYVKGSSTAIGRESGLLAALGDEAEIVATTYSSSEEARAYAQAKEMLALEERPGATRRGILGIAALNLPTLLGAARALEESSGKDRAVLVGFDNSPEVMRLIERGVIRDAIVQKPFNMGYISMETVRALLSGKKPKPYSNTGSVDIDKANMFDPENQKLLFPVASQ
jgi:ribose transport system substrate-binding protein